MSFKDHSILLTLLSALFLCACGQHRGENDEIQGYVDEALSSLHADESALNLPKIGGVRVAERGRLPIVDDALNDPLSMIVLTKKLADARFNGGATEYLAGLFQQFGLHANATPSKGIAPPTAAEVGSALHKTTEMSSDQEDIPVDLIDDEGVALALKKLLLAAAEATESYTAAIGRPRADDLAAIHDHLLVSLRRPEPKPEGERWLMPVKYHEIGARVDISALASALLRLLSVVEEVRHDLEIAARTYPISTTEFDTPLGKVRIGGVDNDTHTCACLLLIDLGGDDVYEEVGRPLGAGGVSIVIDLAGNDTVGWQQNPGPGSAVFGITLWVDMGGNDTYSGRNMGVGTALFGAGLLWDIRGDDSYSGGFMSQGAGQYGVGILLDGLGKDKYSAGIASQGFGGPGGIGLLADLSGDDTYFCGDLVPDEDIARIERHELSHYVSFCQGYAFGLRPEASGGVGLLLDQSGNDKYTADIFAQGGGFWFGLGMLVDQEGNDSYKASEHCQGAAVHLGAAILADFLGRDLYSGIEHCQGVGIDRSAGVLYDAEGDDDYESLRESQGSGIKPFGVGLLIDRLGNDRYTATAASQGYSSLPTEFPLDQWPLGVFLDLAGEDIFRQPDMALPSKKGRISSRGGIAYDY